MSLINEALKRARVEAARRDAAQKGVPPAALPIYLPPRRRPWLAPAAGFAAGLVAVGMAAGAFWLVRRPASAEGPRAAVATEAPGGRPVPARPAPATAPVETAAPEMAPVGARPPQPSAAAPPAVAAAAAEARPPARRTSAPPPVAAPPAAAAPPRSLPPDAAAGAPTLRRSAASAVAGVKVDFIVWSESRPFAQINGQLIGPGQSVDGYTLIQVERERVELEGGGERFWIRVK